MEYRFTDTDAVPVRVPITHRCSTCRHYNPDAENKLRGRCSVSGHAVTYAYGEKCTDHCGKDASRVRWTVYDNATDDVLVACGTIDECCRRLDMTPASFRVAVWRFKHCPTEAEKMAQPYYFVRHVTNW